MGLAIACIIAAELTIGLLWRWILEAFGQSIPLSWTIKTVFKTTLAKYIPGSVWHLVGRVHASKKYGIPLDLVSFSVVLEPMFMIAGGLVVALFCLHYPWAQLLALILFAGLLHPKGINFVFQLMQYFRRNASTPETQSVLMQRYPWREIFAGSTYMFLKGIAFCLTLLCFQPIDPLTLPQTISGFSLAWLLNLVLPAPGGIGVFEAASMQIMNALTSPEVLLSSVLTFRLLSISAEVIGAGLVITSPVVLKLFKRNYHSLKATLIPSTS